MDKRGWILLPKKIREKLGTRRYCRVLRQDRVIGLHPLYDPLKLKGSMRIGISVEELEEAGEKYITKRNS